MFVHEGDRIVMVLPRDLPDPEDPTKTYRTYWFDMWRIEDGKLVKVYPFSNYYQTMAFVNALAWISHREDHHPDLLVGYNKCRVEYCTHAIDGLSENDFICAAKADALFDL